MRASAIVLCFILGTATHALGNTSIHEMVFDNRVLALSRTIQITPRSDGEIGWACLSPDGRHIVYDSISDDYDWQVCVMPAHGQTAPAILAQTVPDDAARQAYDVIACDDGMAVAWSPNSRYLAMWAVRETSDGVIPTRSQGVFVFDPQGRLRSTIPLPDDIYGLSHPPPYADAPCVGMCWSPDSSKIAMILITSTGKTLKQEIGVVDINSRSVEIVPIPYDGSGCQLHSWKKDGRSLYWLGVRSANQTTLTFELNETSRVTEETKMIDADYPLEASPDGALVARDLPSSVTVANRITGEVVEVFRERGDRLFAGWAPNSRMFAYRGKSQELGDETGARKRRLKSLWLAAVEENSVNHMCVALDSEPWSLPSWSEDCMKMAYISDGVVHLAEFKWKELTAQHKLAAGIPLNEDEEREILMANAKQIGAAMAMFSNDWNDKWPDAADLLNSLEPYLLDRDLFFRPGTDVRAFQYFPPTVPIERPAETAIGWFDVGYGWRVVLYADGHVKSVPK